MIKNTIKCLVLSKKIFIRLFTGLVNASNYTKCVSFTNQKCTTYPTLINLHPNECTQELHYSAFKLNLDRCMGNCNTLNDLSNKVCVPSKTENLNLSVFNMITGINEPKTLTKSCKCKWTFGSRKCNSNQKWNNNKCWFKCKNPKKHVCEKDYIWNPANCSCKNGKYLASVTDDSVITCDKMIEKTKAVTTNFNEKIHSVKQKISIFYLPFYQLPLHY